MLYLPLYDQVTELKIGIAPDASIYPAAPRKDKPIDPDSPFAKLAVLKEQMKK